MDLEALSTGTTQTITGLPFVKWIWDKTSLGAEIADIRVMLEAKSSEALQEYKQLMEYISGVQDSHIRRILTFRIIKFHGILGIHLINSIKHRINLF